MINSRVREIKRAQKESLLLKTLSQFFWLIARDNPQLQRLTINRIRLSTDKSHVTVLFYTPGGKKAFDELLSTIILYKPSLRKALAQSIASRYTPEILFEYDAQFEKQCELEETLNKIKVEDKL